MKQELEVKPTSSTLQKNCLRYGCLPGARCGEGRAMGCFVPPHNRTVMEKFEVVLLKWVAKKLGISKEYEKLQRKLNK